MKNFKVIIGFIISILLIWFSCKGIEWNSFKEALSNVSIYTILLVVLINSFVAFIKARRWQVLLSNIDNISFLISFNYINIGYFANSILPARVGEIIRPIMLAKKINKSKIAILASIVLEHLFDFLAILSFFLYTFLIIELPEWLKRGGVSLILISFLCLLISFILAKKDKISVAVINLLPIGEKIKLFLSRKFSNFLLAIKVLTNIKKTLIILFFSTGIWLLYLFSSFIIIKSFNLGINELNASIITMVFISFAMMVPSSPGYFGTYQIACIMSLSLFDVSKTDALAVSFLLQIPVYLLNICLGIFSLWWEGLNFGLIVNQSKFKL